MKIRSTRWDDLYVRVMVRCANICLPLYFRLTFDCPQNSIGRPRNRDEEEYIVSLTSFPARIDKAWLAIESILHQTVKPDRIILWLYDGEFKGRDSLPTVLLRLERRGVEIRFCRENLTPHKKYFFTMSEFPDANIITVDDDVLYPPDLMSKLKRAHDKYPRAIISCITRRIEVRNESVQPYNNWVYLSKNSPPSFGNLAIGVGGVLFPPGSLHPDVLDSVKLKELALRADDLWLKVMAMKRQTKVASIAGEYARFFIPVIRRDDKRLMDLNIGDGQNDKVLKNLMEGYKISPSDFENSSEKAVGIGTGSNLIDRKTSAFCRCDQTRLSHGH